MPSTATARPAQFDRSSQHRRSMLAKVHVARKQLALSEDDYRQILFDETGRLSAGDCSEAQLEKVIGRLKRQGFTPVPSRIARGAAQHPMAKKARAMWISLHQLGVVRNSSEAALEAFAKRQLGCDRLVWARQSHANQLIEALKGMAVRAGWSQRGATGEQLTPVQLREGLCRAILARLVTAGVASPEWSLEQAGFRLCGFEYDEAIVSGAMAEQFARLAAALGDKLRASGAITESEQ